MGSDNSRRRVEVDIDNQFIDRWSPRAFSSKPVDDETLKSLFEAARWAPSCSNEQPWFFLYANKEKDLAYFRPLLDDGNRVWADRAPVLVFVLARRYFERNRKQNDWAKFDAGAAWMSLALQARKRGLYAHGMAGFHREKAYEVLCVSKNEYEVICAVAVGYYGDPSMLPENLAKREQPTSRKPLRTICREGKFQ